MNIPPSEARELSLYEYEGLLWNWNDAHGGDSAGEVPDADTTMVLIDRINADPRFTGARKPKKVN
jgi:hypothetical protein